MKTFEQVVNEILPSPILTELKYRNIVVLSGFILRKPKFIKHDKTDVESCSFILYQIVKNKGITEISSQSCLVYATDLVNQLKGKNNVLFVATLGKFRYSGRVHNYYSHITEMEILYELDIEMADEWRKNNE